LRGKILRLDVESPGTGGYGIPPANPFVGVPGARGEIWAVGVRNPWRSSFDRLTGDFYMADVGQDKFEEINFQAANTPGGLNYGWRLMEGTQSYMPEPGPEPARLTLPVHTYIVDRSGDCSVTGGRVYRGASARMQGIYFYGDFSSGRIWGMRKKGAGWDNRLLRDAPPASGPTFVRDALVTFGEDEAGNIYVSDYRSGRIYMLRDAWSPNNTAPIASNHSAAGVEDQPLNLSISATDADGEPLTYSITTAPTHGTLTGAAPTLIYTPSLNYNGADSFTFRASDGSASSNVATVSLSIAPVNDVPVAHAQSCSTSDGQPISITLSAADADGDALTYVTEDPSNGTLSGTGATRLYTPFTGYDGPDSFTFSVSDGVAQSDIAIVTISTDNVAPNAQPDSAKTKRNTAVIIPVLANDTDANGDALTITQVSALTRGAVAVVGSSIEYTPAKNASGSFTFTYTISDGRGGTGTALVTVAVTPK
jgi:hypothetical protein